MRSPILPQAPAAHHWLRRFSHEDGASLVEAALALTVLFVLLFGIFEFCMGFYAYHYISEAAREGARWASVRGSACSTQSGTYPCPASTDDISNYIEGLGYPGIDSRNITHLDVTTYSTPDPGVWNTCGVQSGTISCNARGDLVQVSIVYKFPLSIPFWGKKSVQFTSTSSMVYSQ